MGVNHMNIRNLVREHIKARNPLDIEIFTVNLLNLPASFEGFTMVHLSDTHLPRMAMAGSFLAYEVKRLEPDIILLTGDIVDRPASVKASGMRKLCKKLVKIAPTFAISGNHEATNGQMGDWQKILRDCNVRLLDDKLAFIDRPGGKLALMGLGDNLPYDTSFIDDPGVRESFCRVLLVHRPKYWEKSYPSDTALAPHLILSGHVHGGQIQIPFIGGLFSPDTGFFPKYSSGMYRTTQVKGKLIVSRGLASATRPVRINNRPHMPVIVLRGEKESI